MRIKSNENCQLARDVHVTKSELRVDLADGRKLSVPIAWFPRLMQASVAAREKWEIIGDGEGIHWPEADEDISVGNLLLGIRSQSSRIKGAA